MPHGRRGRPVQAGRLGQLTAVGLAADGQHPKRAQELVADSDVGLLFCEPERSPFSAIAASTKEASAHAQLVIAVESDHGLLVNALVASGYAVYQISPGVAARCRERDSLAGAKSDQRDAEMLANLVRTDRHRHRPLAGDSEDALEIRARARAHLRAVRTMLRLRGQLRSLLLEFPAREGK